MICQLCEDRKAKYVIRNIHNDNKLNVCTACKDACNFKNELSEEVKM